MAVKNLLAHRRTDGAFTAFWNRFEYVAAHYLASVDKRLEQAADNPRHYEKHKWFARYWNDEFHEVHSGIPKLQGVGLGPTLFQVVAQFLERDDSKFERNLLWRSSWHTRRA